MEKRVIILNYHQINDEKSEGSHIFTISEDVFRKQLEFIYKNEIAVKTLDQIIGETLKEDLAVVFTFDDGNDSDTKIAIPILQEYGYSATFFINSDNENINWNEYKNALQLGFSVESHGTNHQDFKKLSKTQKIHSLKDSKLKIESNLGNEVKYFAFPYGSYTSKDVDLALQNEYKAAFSTKIDGNNFSDYKIYHRWSIKSTTSFESFIRALSDERFFNSLVNKSKLKKGIRSVIGHKLAYKLSKINRL